MLPALYLGLLRKHSGICVALGCIVLTVLAASTRHANTRQAVAYLGAVAISVVTIDAICRLRHEKPKHVPVRNAQLESLVLVAFGVIALAWLTSRFVFDYQPSGRIRLAWLAIGLGAVFNV